MGIKPRKWVETVCIIFLTVLLLRTVMEHMTYSNSSDIFAALIFYFITLLYEVSEFGKRLGNTSFRKVWTENINKKFDNQLVHFKNVLL